jgi:hypothetical protein
VCASSKYRFFWLILHGRCWTSERLHRHGLHNHGPCVLLCSQEAETIDHLFVQCVFIQEVWFKVLRCCGWQHLTPSSEDSAVAWWLSSRKAVDKPWRCSFDSLVLLVVWSCWTTCLGGGGGASGPPVALVDAIWASCDLWCRSKLLVGSIYGEISYQVNRVG